jgi:hypothetical protein
MPRPKAARAAAPKAHDPRRVDQLAGTIDANATPDILTMQPVYDGPACIGFIYMCGRLGVEAFDADTRSLGIFVNSKTAAEAVVRAAGGAP